MTSAYNTLDHLLQPQSLTPESADAYIKLISAIPTEQLHDDYMMIWLQMPETGYADKQTIVSVRLAIIAELKNRVPLGGQTRLETRLKNRNQEIWTANQETLIEKYSSLDNNQNMNTIFHDPRKFLEHLEASLGAKDNLTEAHQTQLLHGCLHTLRYMLDSQNVLTERMVKTLDVLNAPHETWGHKLSELYTLLEAGAVTPEEMNAILVREVCSVPKS